MGLVGGVIGWVAWISTCVLGGCGGGVRCAVGSVVGV